MESFCSGLFFVQIGTSGLCICASIYSLAFVNQFSFIINFAALKFLHLQNISDNLLERTLNFVVMLYILSEIFMITYFGNEIKLSSNRLSYSLFESTWINQTHSTKKCVIIFGEYLKQPHQLVIGKLYPLTLETFTRVRLNCNWLVKNLF